MAAGLLAGAALRLHLALTNHGIYWPDEIFKGTETAHRLVFGYGLVPWELVEGAVSWAFPALITGLLKAVTLAGADEPGQYLASVRVVLSLVALAAAYGACRLARTAGAEALPAACGAVLLALAAPAVYFAPRALSENVSALPVVAGFALALRRTRALAIWLRQARCSGSR